MNPPTSQSSTGSREKIKCQYCESVIERRNLKGHTTRVHAGLSPDALDLHFSKSRLGWHFTTNTLFHSVGPTVDKILKMKNKLNIY